jgi:ribose 5-phosphate isomerase B
MRIVIGSDHAGFALKSKMSDVVRALGHDILDVGAFNENPSDYPEFAELVGRAITDGKSDRGMLFDGCGVGMTIAANKIPGIRAATCHDTCSAHQGVEHDDMNVLVLGSRIIGEKLAEDLVKSYLAARFTNEARHVRRLNKVKAFESRLFAEPART